MNSSFRPNWCIWGWLNGRLETQSLPTVGSKYHLDRSQDPGIQPGFRAWPWQGFELLLFHFPISPSQPWLGAAARSPSQDVFFLVSISMPFLTHGSTLIFGDLLFATDINRGGQSYCSWESRGISLRNNCRDTLNTHGMLVCGLSFLCRQMTSYWRKQFYFLLLPSLVHRQFWFQSRYHVLDCLYTK